MHQNGTWAPPRASATARKLEARASPATITARAWFEKRMWPEFQVIEVFPAPHMFVEGDLYLTLGLVDELSLLCLGLEDCGLFSTLCHVDFCRPAWACHHDNGQEQRTYAYCQHENCQEKELRDLIPSDSKIAARFFRSASTGHQLIRTIRRQGCNI